jgi:hypothetical protein
VSAQILDFEPVEIKVSPNTGMPTIESTQDDRVLPMAELAIRSGQYIDARYVENSLYPDEPGIWHRSVDHAGDQLHRLVEDYRNFYLTDNLWHVGIAIGVAAPFANTHADIGIRDWYQQRVRNGQSRGLDETARVFKWFGDWRYTVPIYLAFSLSGNFCPYSPAIGTVAEFGDRSLRALAVGAPTVGLLQVGLGADRPLADDSRWHPFRSNKSVSGHAFVGAVPFLTAASMTDSYALKALLIAGSLGPAWSRIHDDDHYLSQALLGWAIAYLSVRSVNQTESWYRIVPCEFPRGVGIGVQIQY